MPVERADKATGAGQDVFAVIKNNEVPLSGQRRDDEISDGLPALVLDTQGVSYDLGYIGIVAGNRQIGDRHSVSESRHWSSGDEQAQSCLPDTGNSRDRDQPGGRYEATDMSGFVLAADSSVDWHTHRSLVDAAKAQRRWFS
jgi:hypothetical protein